MWARELLKYRPSYDGTKTDTGIDCAQPPHRAVKLKSLLSSSASTDVTKQASIFGSNLELNRQLDGRSFNSTFESLLRDDKGDFVSSLAETGKEDPLSELKWYIHELQRELLSTCEELSVLKKDT